jgi:hypothetical protein
MNREGPDATLGLPRFGDNSMEKNDIIAIMTSILLSGRDIVQAIEPETLKQAIGLAGQIFDETHLRQTPAAMQSVIDEVKRRQEERTWR